MQHETADEVHSRKIFYNNEMPTNETEITPTEVETVMDSSSESSMDDNYLSKYSSDPEELSNDDAEVLGNSYGETDDFSISLDEIKKDERIKAAILGILKCSTYSDVPNLQDEVDREEIGKQSTGKLPIPVQSPPSPTKPEKKRGIPNPNDAPKAASDIILNGRDDYHRNKKVLEYLDQLEEAERDVNQRFKNKEKVAADEIKTLKLATDAILKEYGYDFTDKEEQRELEHRARKRERRKYEFPRGVSVSSSESDCSDRPLKEEIVRRLLASKAGEDSSQVEWADLMEHSPKWQKWAAEEKQGENISGHIEKMTTQMKKFIG